MKLDLAMGSPRELCEDGFGVGSSIRTAPAEPPSRARPEGGARPMPPEARAALRTMFDENFAFIWRILRRLGVPPQNVDDAAQQVFYVAARKVDTIEIAKARSFLLGSALRVAAEARRTGARGREVASDALDAEPSCAPSPEELAERKQSLEFLDGVLQAMPFELRTVFVLYEIEGMSTHDIAPALELPRGTVASRLRRAREEFHAIAKRAQARAASHVAERGGKP